MNDNRQLLTDLVVTIKTIAPEIDDVKLSLRVEEVISNYKSQLRSQQDQQNDLLNNIKIYISAKRLEGLSEITLEDYWGDLTRFEYKIQKSTATINTADIRSYLSSLEGIQASTQGKKLSVIKSFFEWLVEEEIILKNPARRIKQMKQPKRLPKALTSTELEMLREACEAKRERALIEVLYSTGCRLSEISNMKIENINWSSNSVRVVGKGDKERIAYLNPKAVFHLERYFEDRRINEDTSEYVFTTIRRPYRQAQRKTIQDIIGNIASRTDITKKVTPHVFRHTMATLAMENGIELGDLQQLLGHSDPGTTLRYAEVSEERKHHAHKRFVR